MSDLVLPAAEYGDQDGPPTVAVHGLGKTSRHWARLGTEGLPERRWICPDLRGHGDSQSESPPWTEVQMARDVLATLDAHKVGSFDVIGHSMGGRVAASVCAQAPTRVRQAVLLDPAAMTAEQHLSFRDEWTRPFVDSLRHEYATVAELLTELEPVLRQLPAEARRHAELEAGSWLQATETGRYRFRMDTRLLYAIVDGMAEYPHPDFGAYRGPVLLVVAGINPACSEEGEQTLRQHLGDQLAAVTLEDAGHNLLWGRFEETAALIGSFLKGPSTDEGVDPQPLRAGRERA